MVRPCQLAIVNHLLSIPYRNEKYLIPTNKCFWKDPKDIINAVKTRSQLKKQPTAHYETIDKYFEQRVNKIIKDQLTNFEEKAIETIDG